MNRVYLLINLNINLKRGVESILIRVEIDGSSYGANVAPYHNCFQPLNLVMVRDSMIMCNYS